MSWSAVGAGALAGVLTATVQDRQSFKGFKTYRQFAEYDWGLFAFRAAQGAVIGALSSLGVSFL